jgi:hypothetical protein
MEDSVQTLLKYGAVIVMSIALGGLPVSATPATAPLGVIVTAQGPNGLDLTSTGSTVYEGDRLETGGNGTLRARLGGAQLFLSKGTTAQVHGLGSGFSASLLRGTVVASSAQGESFRVLANGAAIRPADSQPAVAQVTWLSPHQLLLTSRRGTLEISMGDEVKTIEEGASYRMEIEAEADPQQPSHMARNRFLVIAVLGVSAAVGIGVWRASISSDVP